MDKVEQVEKNETADKPESTEKPEKDAQKFDWVTRRSACSLPKIFKDLRLQVEEDIKIRNGLRPNNSPYEFLVTDIGADFSVVLKTKEVQKSVIFSLAEHAILVKDNQGKQVIQVNLTFDDHGECKLRVGDQERELWQVRRMALEDMLFRGY